MPASKRRIESIFLAALPLALFLPTGCFTSVERETGLHHGFTKQEIRRTDMPAVDSNGYYYQHHVYNHLYYNGEPDSMVGILKTFGLEIKEVWADSGPCFTGGKPAGTLYTLMIRTDRDYGELLHPPGEGQSSIMERLAVGLELENLFDPCDSGKMYFHYRAGQGSTSLRRGRF